MAKVNIGTAVNTLMIGSADQKQIMSILNALVDDMEKLRANQFTLAAKLDLDAGVTDTNYGALASTPAGGLSVAK